MIPEFAPIVAGVIGNNHIYFDIGPEVLRYDRHRFVTRRKPDETLEQATARVDDERRRDQERIRRGIATYGFLRARSAIGHEFIVDDTNIDCFL